MIETKANNARYRTCRPTMVHLSTTKRAAQFGSRSVTSSASRRANDSRSDKSDLRTTAKLETSDERYSWLNDLVLPGYNELPPGHIDFRIYRVL
jgi:hypothetical protein